jgi:hypothetical protein
MKGFYETYASSEKLAPLVREIAWSHNLVILERCTDLLEREFYVRMTKKTPAQGTQGAVAGAGGDRQTAGGWGMNRSAQPEVKIRICK